MTTAWPVLGLQGDPAPAWASAALSHVPRPSRREAGGEGGRQREEVLGHPGAGNPASGPPRGAPGRPERPSVPPAEPGPSSPLRPLQPPLRPPPFNEGEGDFSVFCFGDFWFLFPFLSFLRDCFLGALLG